jgi:hypothetical protein
MPRKPHRNIRKSPAQGSGHMSFSISIVAGQDPSSSRVSTSGTVQHVITDTDRATFGIADAPLKKAVNIYFGKAPTDVFVRSPTPRGDLYQNYGWPQVQTILSIQGAEIVDNAAEDVVVKTQLFINDGAEPADVDVALTEQVDNATNSSWTSGANFKFDPLDYQITFLAAGGGSDATLSYSQGWGAGEEASQSIGVGIESGLPVGLEAGESVVAELTISRVTMKVRITYNAHLVGSIALNYNPTFKGHHFWTLDIGGVMNAANIANANVSTEEITIVYCTNARIVLKDQESGEVTAVYSMADVAGH